jgi:hypothetical protein
MRLSEPTEANAKLQRIDAGVRPDQSGIGNVHEAQLSAPVVLAAQEMSPDRSARREIHV